MKTALFSTSICLALLMAALSIYAQPFGKAHKPKIIFDTDMGPDYDDIGAISILHALASKGECEILATVASDAHPSIAPTIATFNQYFKHPEIPVGTAPANAPAFTADNHWTDSLVARFAPALAQKKFPSAVTIYRQVLAAQPDQSVTIVTVGFTSNLHELLQSAADQYSPLSGAALIKRKVKNWVAMAGGFPQGKEFNVAKDSTASYAVFSKWPTPILFSGFEIGLPIVTGGKVATQNGKDNPVAWGYAYNLRTYTANGEQNRPSWDHTAVLCAIRDPEQYFYVIGPGTFEIKPDGSNQWNPSGSAKHYFLVHKYPYDHVAQELEFLMHYQP